jgi:CubicO group peptidase (beta-lactamase class C family)
VIHAAFVTLSFLLAQTRDPTSIARVDSVVTSEARAGFSGVVLIAQGDTVLLDRAYGKVAAAPTGAGEPAFWLASNSKQFTAAAILRLQEAGRLRVTDSIGVFFKDVPADKRAITIHQLLTHTSGLPTAYQAEGVVDRDRAVAVTLGLKLQSRPGESYSYSNDGYCLLAAIVDIASGVGFDAFVRDSLIGRAGMTHSGVWGQERGDVPIAALANPRRTQGRLPTIYRNGHSVGNWGYRGPGGVYATAGDAHKWIQALRSGGILSEPSLRALLGRHVLVKQDSTVQNFAGYGWGVRVERGRDVSYGHVGDDDWLGHNGVIRFTPEGTIVVVLSNSGEVDGEGWASRVNRAIRRIMDAPR